MAHLLASKGIACPACEISPYGPRGKRIYESGRRPAAFVAPPDPTRRGRAFAVAQPRPVRMVPPHPADPMCLAVPGKILDLQGDDPLLRSGRVNFGGIVKQVSLGCVPEAKVGDYVLVHVGMALHIVDEKEAAEVFRYLKEMGELDGLELPPAPAPGS